MAKKLLKAFFALLLLAAVFAGGYVVRAIKHPAAAASGRRILYYVDPMHPAYKSDKPGIAPDCGMQLEPVYAHDKNTPLDAVASAPAGTIRIPPERQQLIGVKFATVEAGGRTRSIR